MVCYRTGPICVGWRFNSAEMGREKNVRGSLLKLWCSSGMLLGWVRKLRRVDFAVLNINPGTITQLRLVDAF
jgi:hypothetical protein